MYIQHITPEMIKANPDQVCLILNKVIDFVNSQRSS